MNFLEEIYQENFFDVSSPLNGSVKEGFGIMNAKILFSDAPYWTGTKYTKLLAQLDKKNYTVNSGYLKLSTRDQQICSWRFNNDSQETVLP